MPMKQYNPTSPGRRFVTTLDFSELTKKEPERKLTEPLRRQMPESLGLRARRAAARARREA